MSYVAEPDPGPGDDMNAAVEADPDPADGLNPSEGSGFGLVDDQFVGGVALFAVAGIFIGFSADSSMDWIFPRMLAYVLIAVAVVLIVRGFLGTGRKVNIIPSVLLGRGVDVAVFILMVTLFVVLARPVGFWIMALVTLLAASLYLATRRDVKVVLQSLAMATGVVIIGYVALLEFFFVPLDIFGTWWPF